MTSSEPAAAADEPSETPSTRLVRRVEDTSSGCRDRAAASLAAAAGMDTANGKSQLEASAATWTGRADLLERLELLHEARRVAGASDEQPDA